jgi:hypothetical protein
MIEVVHPRMLSQNHAAVIHAKLFLFEFASFLRVVISSANLTRQDWEGLAQVFFEHSLRPYLPSLFIYYLFIYFCKG